MPTQGNNFAGRAFRMLMHRKRQNSDPPDRCAIKYFMAAKMREDQESPCGDPDQINDGIFSLGCNGAPGPIWPVEACV